MDRKYLKSYLSFIKHILLKNKTDTKRLIIIAKSTTFMHYHSL